MSNVKGPMPGTSTRQSKWLANERTLSPEDHHRFDRVVQWADRRQRAHPQGQVYVQYGQSTPVQNSSHVL